MTKPHLSIGIPCYGGMTTSHCLMSMLKFAVLAERAHLSWSVDSMGNESLVTRARNNLMARMLGNPNATHFMFIDADIHFDPQSIFDMLKCDRDVIGGVYPKKSVPPDYVLNTVTNGESDAETFEVAALGNGFLMFKRHVYEKLIAAHPNTKYCDEVNAGKEFEPNMYAIFDTAIVGGRYLSEDWEFCRRWRALGGKLYAHRKTLLHHVGTHVFQGDLGRLAQIAPPIPNAPSKPKATITIGKSVAPAKKR